MDESVLRVGRDGGFEMLPRGQWIALAQTRQPFRIFAHAAGRRPFGRGGDLVLQSQLRPQTMAQTGGQIEQVGRRSLLDHRT